LEVLVSNDRLQAIEIVELTPPRLVLLDLRWSGRNGGQLCRDIRIRSPRLPILVLSDAVDVLDRVLLLERGADDYITKPFSPRELLARVQVALRRANSGFRGIRYQAYSFDEIEVNFDKMELTRAGKPVPMTRQEFKMLKYFLTNKQRVVSRDELLNEVWGYSNDPNTRTVDTHICRLRRKLEKDPLEPAYFQTVYGTGYRFLG
jgi:DNA-binding response OmpR family regulator